MAIPAGIMSAILSLWNNTEGLSTTIPLKYARQDELVPLPRAIFFDVNDVVMPTFDNTNILDKFTYQFSVFCNSIVAGTNTLDLIRTAFHRQSIPMAGGNVLCCLRIGSGVLIDKMEDGDSLPVYIFWSRFSFLIET